MLVGHNAKYSVTNSMFESSFSRLCSRANSDMTIVKTAKHFKRHKTAL